MNPRPAPAHPARLPRWVAVVVACAVALLGAGVPAHAADGDDVSGPAVVGSALTPTTVDPSSGPVDVEVSLLLVDDSGVAGGTVTATTVGTDEVVGTAALAVASVDGTVERWTATLTIPQGPPEGRVAFTVHGLVDVLGNPSGSLLVGHVELAPEPLVPASPVVLGERRVGATLHAHVEPWTPAPVELTYQWLRTGVPIAGATGHEYTLTDLDAGRTVSVTVTGTRAGQDPQSRTSEPVLVEKVLTATPVPRIGGMPRAGQRLTATVGTWAPSPVTLRYRWYRDGEPIPGGVYKSYLVSRADAGALLTVGVTGSRTGYTPVTTVSSARRVEKLLTATPAPRISGAKDVGARLTAVPGTWSPAPVTLTYRWKRNGAPIAYATGRTYRLTKADAGRSVTVTVTGRRAGYTPVARTSAGVRVLRQLTPTPTPTITGTARSGRTLTAAAGTWGPGQVSLGYRWKRDGVAISGATGRSYRLTGADVGRSVTVTVTGRKSGYTSVSRTSRAVRPTSSVPARPADKDCGDFSTWRQAQDFFEKYYPYYGDVADLDRDGDLIACEALL